MAIKLHRCKNIWLKTGTHPCWKVQRTLDEMGVDYEIVPLPWPAIGKRQNIELQTGQSNYPAIEFEDGTWYRDGSKEMVQTIRAGRLDEKHGVTPASASAA
jgi:hypothetical protein